MTVGGFRVCDADGHVVEPGHVFERWTSGRLPMDLPEDTPMVPCGDLALLDDQFAHGFDSPSYVRALDAQGIDVAVLYPSIGLFVPYLPELTAAESAAACRSYNEWISGYCDEADGRLFAAGLVPLADLAAAEDEARWCAEAGLVAVMVRPNHVYGRNLGDPAHDPLYEAVVEAGLVLAVHEGLGLTGHPTIGADRFSGFGLRHALSHPMEQMASMASLALDGALDRHPDLRIAFLESGTGWLPYWLHRLDEHHGSGDPVSAHFARRCVISTEADDALAPTVIADVGGGHVVWASDFPHPDAVFPGSAREFVDRCTAAGTPNADLSAVLWDTPIEFYGLGGRIPGGIP